MAGAGGAGGRRGPSWVELSVALTALVVSVASLLVARHQAQVMDRQLAASVWPVVTYYNSNGTRDGAAPVVTLSLRNGGVGPTRIRSFRIAYRGRPVADANALLNACCALDSVARALAARGRPLQGWSVGYVLGRVVTAGEAFDFLTVPYDPAYADAFARVARMRDEIAVRACYCSVLDDCWVYDAGREEPAPVKSCDAERARPQYR